MKNRYLYALFIILGIFITVIFLFQKNILTLGNNSVCAAGTSVSSSPRIEYFYSSNNAPVVGETITIFWKTANTDNIYIPQLDQFFGSTGSAEIKVTRPERIRLQAYKGSCYATKTLFIDTYSMTPPWLLGLALFVALMVLDAVRLGMASDISIGKVDRTNIWTAIQTIFQRVQSKKAWGIVYDSITKKPLPRSVVRLFESATGKLLETSVTDVNGVFRLMPMHGNYYIKVFNNGYTFPSQTVPSGSDGAYLNVYKGEPLEILVDHQFVHVSIPLDPLQINQTSKIVRQSFLGMEFILRIVSLLLLTVGTALSFANLLHYQNIPVILLFFVYVLFIAIQVIFAFIRPKEHGTVTDKDGKPVPNLEIGVYETEFNTLVAKTFTDQFGHYYFIVPFQGYKLRLLDSLHRVIHPHTETGEIPVPTPKTSEETLILVAEDIKVEKLY
jgi:hypothetical protein